LLAVVAVYDRRTLDWTPALTERRYICQSCNRRNNSSSGN
jgi:hypothetical protein